MSFIPEDEKNTELAEPEKNSPKDQKEEKKMNLSGVKSLVLLIVILVGLFYLMPYFNGQKGAIEIPNLSLSGDKTKNGPSSELKVPTVLNKEVRKLLQEFKAEYAKIVPVEEVISTQPSIRAAKFSKDRTKLLLELEHIEPAKGEGAKPTSISTDLIFTEDEFGRLVTTGRFAGIKLYPEEK